MGVLKRLLGYINKKEQVDISPRLELFTKYGPARAQMYKYRGVEYLLFVSPNMDKEQINMGYIYLNKHAQHKTSGIECNCNNQIDVALKMILQEQGFAIYASQDPLDIEMCLHRVGANSVAEKSNCSRAESTALEHELDSSEYALFISIMQELGVQKVRMISNDPGVALHIQRLGIELVEWASVIGFEYGDPEH